MFAIGFAAWILGWFLAFYLSDMSWFFVGIIVFFATQLDWSEPIKGFRMIRNERRAKKQQRA